MANFESPTERPALSQVESPSAHLGRLKYSVDPFNPPEDDGIPCDECDGEGCECCGGSGFISEEELRERNQPEFEPEDRF